MHCVLDAKLFLCSGVSRILFKRGQERVFLGGKEGAKRTNLHVSYQSRGGGGGGQVPPL